MATGVSILKPLGYQKSRQCGYCQRKDGSCSYYMSCDNMRIDHYQELMDRGWRRSGTTYYKPDLPHSCCPHYTIRLPAADFQAKKEQRSAINKLNDYITGPEYRRKAAMLCPQTRELKSRKRDKFELQDVVHKSEYDKIPKPVGKKTQKPIGPAHKYEVTLEGDSYTKEKHEILLKYQTKIHQDPEWRWSEAAFTRFLCSGLDRKTLKIKGKTMKLGSYHQCYRIDGKLVAVGVLDLLPHAVSSVYLFYDPDWQEWDWGKISALREIALTIEGAYEYYYMGYYIHSCTKMRYKGRYEPSYLLDPESLTWNKLDDQLRKNLDQHKYFSPANPARSSDEAGNEKTISADMPQSNVDTATQREPVTTVEAEGIEVDSDPSDHEDTDIPEGSLFDYGIPGVLTKQEVLKLDLDHMKLLVRTALIDLEDLRGWEEWKIDDPGTIKGIAAELIATTGPKLLENSALALF